MADVPEGIVLRRHRDLAGRRWHPWLRRALVGLVGLFAVLGLFDVFGQRPATARVSADAATLRISAPHAVRGGLLFQARFTIVAHEELKDATLVLGQGWLDGLTVNTIEPSPLSEASRDGSLVFGLGHLAAGAKYVLYIEYQVNPTTVGRRTQTIELADGEVPILSTKRSLMVYP